MTVSMMCWKTHFWDGVEGYDGSRTLTTKYVMRKYPRQLGAFNHPYYDSYLLTYNQTLMADLIHKYDVSPPGTQVRRKIKPWGKN